MLLRKILLFVGAALLIIAFSAGSTYFVMYRIQAATGDMTVNSEPLRKYQFNEKPVSFVMDRITTNLADASGNRFIQVGIEVWVINEEVQQLLQDNHAEVRAQIIGILRSKTSSDLGGADGMEQLAEEMKHALGQIYDERAIKAVHLTEFLIQ